jgi:uncharacterized protein
MIGRMPDESTFLVTYRYVPGMEERRTPHRAAHLEWLRELHAAGRLLLAGALQDPVDTGVLIFRAPDGYTVRQLLMQDPYARAELIVEVSVRPYGIAVGA